MRRWYSRVSVLLIPALLMGAPGAVSAGGRNRVSVDRRVPPTAPTDLNAVAWSSSCIRLTWTDRSSTETSYAVERRSAGGSWARLARLGADASGYTDRAVASESTYSYRVSASNAYGASAYTAGTTVTTPAPVPGQPMGILVPAYFYPRWTTPQSNYWDDVALAAGRVPIIAIMNPRSGPGSMGDANYRRALAEVHQSGGRVIGYVPTAYGARPLAAVKLDVDRYYYWYPGIDGIFFDEASGTATAKDLAYYQTCFDYVRAKDPAALVQHNQGGRTDQEYTRISTQISVFEGDVSAFGPEAIPEWSAGVPGGCLFTLAYLADAAAMRVATATAAVNNVGWVYFTDDAKPNPWNSLPTYWEEEVAQVAALLVGGPAARPVVALETAAPVPVPAQPLLVASYPNPFNPATTIRFSLPAGALVSLQVFNAQGQQVAELIADVWYEPGEHEVAFDARGLASGTYLYRVSAGGLTTVGRMTLMR